MTKRKKVYQSYAFHRVFVIRFALFKLMTVPIGLWPIRIIKVVLFILTVLIFLGCVSPLVIAVKAKCLTAFHYLGVF